MPFAGSKIPAPAMAAARGMQDVSMNQVTDKTAQPLAQAVTPAPQRPAAGPSRPMAGQVAGSPASIGKDLAEQPGAASSAPSTPGETPAPAGSSGLPLAALTELAPGMLPSPPDFLDIPKPDPLAIFAPARQRFQALAANRPRAPMGAAGAPAAPAGGADPSKRPDDAQGESPASMAEEAAGAVDAVKSEGSGSEDPRPARDTAGMPAADAAASGGPAPQRRASEPAKG
ncbi:hypothetical protein ACFW16_01245 [Inquilinus sp. NPDC058860]|uniref:hypothetical protein n=1 Tax=Inquilinus sp. NPDC058860 TaxID=3346652 RepID=UPI00369705C1